MVTMPWPAKSPDLNVIENLWFILKHKLSRRLDEITSDSDLERSVIVEIWDDISVGYIRKLYESLPNRLSKVQKLKGHLTKY